MKNGHRAVVKILLGRDDIDPDKLGGGSQTPLLLAARNGHEGIVKMLLGRDDVNPRSQICTAKHHLIGLLTMGTRE